MSTWGTREISSASSSYFTLGKSLCKQNPSHCGCKTPKLLLPTSSPKPNCTREPRAEVAGPNKPGSRQKEQAGRHRRGLPTCRHSHSPAQGKQPRQHRAPLTLNASLQMQAADHNPFPSVAEWACPQAISPRLVRASGLCAPWEHTSAKSLPKSPKYSFIL